ncbi:MAG: hypothetical protein HY531_03975 [Chloroflexi bacterium]|nr:hypothetical protein [Chloroflexota bacterium]
MVTREILEQGLGLTLAAFGGAFVVMALILVLMIGLGRALQTRIVQKWTGALAAAEATAAARNRALAAAIAVGVALTTPRAASRSSARDEDAARRAMAAVIAASVAMAEDETAEGQRTQSQGSA